MSVLALYQDIKETFYSNKKKVALDGHYPLMRWFYRPLSFFPAALCIRLGISANQVTLFNILVLISSLVSFSFWNSWSIALGLSFYFIFYLLDFVDGNIARFTKKNSYFGQLIDGFVDSLGFLIFAVIASAFFVHNENIESRYLTLFLGVAASLGALISQIFRARLLYYTALAASKKDGLNSKQEEDVGQNKGRLNLVRLINIFFLNTMTATPLVLAFFLLLNRIDGFILLYFVIHVLGSVASIVGLTIKNLKSLAIKND